MTSNSLAEIALRKVFFDISNGPSGNTVENIAESAITHLSSLVPGSFSSDEQIPVMNAQEALIRGGIKIAAKFYEIYTDQSQEVGRKRLNFDKEIKSHLATMMVRKNIETRHYSDEEILFLNFLELFDRDNFEDEEEQDDHHRPDVRPYLGIKESSVKEDSLNVDADFYSVPEFFEMSRLIKQPLVDDLPSARVCRAISRFFKTQLPLFLNEITNEFNRRFWVFEVIRSLVKGENFLNKLRLRRFIIISLSNMLWSLQYPVNTRTGYELGLNKKIELCREASAIINRLLDKKNDTDISKLGIHNSLINFLRNEKNSPLMNFVRQIELYVSELTDAFEEEKLKSLNMKEIVSKSRATATNLIGNIFKLIYGKPSYTTFLVNKIDLLNLLLKNNQEICSKFSDFDVKCAEKNSPPKTVVDLLIVFSHLSESERGKLTDKLQSSKIVSWQTFGQTLADLDVDYLKPLATHCLSAIKSGQINAKVSDVDKIVAHRFLPLLALVITDDIDNDETKASKKIAEKNNSIFFTAKEQLEIILRISYSNERNLPGQYTLDLSPYLALHRQIIKHINELPRRQYKLGQLTTLLSALQSFISQYKTFLLYPKFKEFVVESLSLVGEEFSSLKKTLDKLNEKTNAKTNDERGLVNTIKSMDQSLMNKVDIFKSDIVSLSRKINSAEFEDSLREDMISRLSDLRDKFSDAFGKQQLGMLSILEEATPILTRNTKRASTRSNIGSNFQPTINEDNCSDQEIVALSNLLNNCLWQLSRTSASGRKGQMLRQLRTDLAKKRIIQKSDAKRVVSEIARITCAYQRNFYFFHQGYSKTQSAVVLISEINRSMSGSGLPIAEMLFGRAGLERAKHYNDLTQWSQDELIKLKKKSRWAVDAMDLRPVSKL